MRWFRFYHEALDDPKVQRLSPDLFKAWVNLLCVAAKNGGKIPSDVEDLAFTMRLSTPKLNSQIESLVAAGLLDKGETLHPHNWDERQYASDDVSARVKRFRERKSNVTRDVACNVTETAGETPPETDTESDTEQKQREEEAQALSAWQVVAQEHGLAKIAKLTKARRSHLKARLADCGGLDGWLDALKRIRGSPFALGKNARGWKIDFDFLVSESGFTKLMEGKYDGTNGVQGPKSGGLTGFAAVAAELAVGRGFGRLDETGDSDGGGDRRGEGETARSRDAITPG